MFGFSKKTSYFESAEYAAEREILRKEWEDAAAQKKLDDAAANQRALSYDPPVRVIKGKHNEFLEVSSTQGRTLCVPLALVAATQLSYRDVGSINYRREAKSPSDIANIVVEMASGTKHTVAVEVASAELLLAAIDSIWRAA